jgi:hypothetical protein
MPYGREKSVPCREGNSGRLARSLVTVLTAQPQLKLFNPLERVVIIFSTCVNTLQHRVLHT